MMIPWRRLLAARFWGRTFRHGGISTWMHEAGVRAYINESVTGGPNVWPMEWLRQLLGARAFDKGLSLGCGDGALERDIRRKNICRDVLGIDASSEALTIAWAKSAHSESDRQR
jgi:2-polyprenyl-3-methyl-5-hydroxy-6-metoxy-1,4-benzoquinol methylase